MVYGHFMVSAYSHGDRVISIHPEVETEDIMLKRLIGMAGLAVAFIFIMDGTGATISSASAVSPWQVNRWAHSARVSLDAGAPLSVAAASDSSCDAQGPDVEDQATESGNATDTVQNENGADDATEANGEQQDANDTDNLQCGDQNDNAASSQVMKGMALSANVANTPSQATAQTANETGGESNTEQENATSVETGNDQAIDGVQCEQQGEHEGENAGC